jgi:hypothetical protein
MGGMQMAKCFITGVDAPITEMYVLDTAAAYRELRSLRYRAATIDRLIDQLSPYDEVEVYNYSQHQIKIRRNRRLMTSAVAGALSQSFRDAHLLERMVNSQKGHR